MTLISLLAVGAVLLSDWLLQRALQGDWHSRFYRGEKLPAHYLSGNVIPLGEVRQRLGESDDEGDRVHWRDFHFAQYLVPIPYEHPFYWVSFSFDFDSRGEVMIGLNYFNHHGKLLLMLKPLTSKVMGGSYHQHSIFSFSTQIIEQWALPELWAEIFVKKLTIPPFYRWSYQELIKVFYLAHLRTQILPDDGNALHLVPATQVGLVFQGQDETGYQLETLYLHRISDRGRLEALPFQLAYLAQDVGAQSIRYQILKKIVAEKSVPELAETIMKEFEGLPVVDQISPRGTLYLVSAWSHDQRRKELLQKAISFLVRSGGSFAQLTPLHHFFRRHYGKDVLRSLKQPTAPGLQRSKASQTSSLRPPSRREIIRGKLRAGKERKLQDHSTLYLD